MASKYIRMTALKEDLQYEICRAIDEEAKNFLAQENQTITSEDFEKLSEAITDLGIWVNADDRIKNPSTNDQLYQLPIGNRPYFLNLEKDLVKIIVGLILSIIDSFPDSKEKIIPSLGKIVMEIYSLYYALRIEIKNIDYCIYMYCRAKVTATGFITEKEVLEYFIQQGGKCSGCPKFPKIGQCYYFNSDGSKCRINETDIKKSLEQLCTVGVLKPVTEGLYRFYR